jgi:hypothetical protein
MIGHDFEKIHFDIWGFHFLEPNALIGDVILFGTSLFLAAKIKKISSKHPFYQNWRRFYLIFGFSFLLGGFGHFFYPYLGLWGKYPSWILSMLSTYFLGLAQISLWPNLRQQQLFKKAAMLLLLLGVVIELIVFNTVDLSIDQSRGLAVPSIVSGIGMIFSLLFLGIIYQNKYSTDFKFFWIAVLTLFPSAMIQSQKINLAPWFDRNDFSHVLLFICLFLYWKGIQAFKGLE